MIISLDSIFCVHTSFGFVSMLLTIVCTHAIQMALCAYVEYKGKYLGYYDRHKTSHHFHNDNRKYEYHEII